MSAVIKYFLMLLVSSQTTANNDDKIYGGQRAQDYSYPWMVLFSFEIPGTICGGALVHMSVAMTACHCIAIEDTNPIEMYPTEKAMGLMGVYESGVDSKKVQIRAAKEFVIHEDCAWDVYPKLPASNDAGAVVFEKPFEFSLTVQPVPAATVDEWEYLHSINSSCYLSGFGITSPESHDPSPYLKELEVKLMSEAQCAAEYTCGEPDWKCLQQLIASGMSCADKPGTPCPGDSGSPYVCNIHERWVLVGLHSADACSKDTAFVFVTPRSFLSVMHQAQALARLNRQPAQTTTEALAMSTAFSSTSCCTYLYAIVFIYIKISTA